MRVNHSSSPAPTSAQVEATLKKASGLRRALTTNLLAAAAAYVQARRVVQGVDLQYAIQVGSLGVLAERHCRR